MLDYRAEQVDRCQQIVAEEEAKRLHLLQRLAEYDQIIAQAFTEQQQTLQSPRFDPVQAGNFTGYVWRLKQLKAQEHQALQHQEQKVLTARKSLQEAMIKKKSLEILKEKEQKKYFQKLEKMDEDFLAELALNRYARKQQG